MLKRLSTKNFRKLTDAEFSFTNGMQIIRGGNEMGKSTLAEAIGYAMFGAKALRTPLADAVTWGQKDSALKVELDIVIEGTLYRVSRSKSGAEVNYAGGKVTGQTETAAFIGKLLGVSNQNVNRLMLAKQNQIRGALDQGPAATMQMIEELSDFAVLDRVVEAIQQKLVTGPSKWAEEKVEVTAATVLAKQALCVKPDLEGMERAIAAASEGQQKAMLQLSTLAPTLAATRARLVAISTAQQTKDRLEKSLVAQGLREAGLKDELVKLQAAAVCKVAEDELVRLQEAVSDEKVHSARLSAYKSLLGIQADVADKGVSWDSDWASLNAEVDAVSQRMSQLNMLIQKADSNIEMWKSQITASSICGFCAKDFSQFPEVAANNAKLSAMIEEAGGHAQGWKGELEGAKQEHIQLKDMVKFAQGVEARYSKIAAFINLDASEVPAKAIWQGDVPEDRPAAVEGAKKLLEEARQEVVRAQQARQQAALKLGSLTELQAQIERDKALLAVVVVEDDTPLKLAEALLVKEQDELLEEADENRNAVSALTSELKLAQAAYQQALQAAAEAEASAVAAQAELRRLNFNNALLKKVRAARPLIADKLWNTVLAAVSHYATQMRGVTSVVTKAADGFKVDGQAVESLSGSALDVLGLAIRLALVRTFLPTAPFLILDEPGAACDDQRHASMMGFLLTAGIPQTLVITHHDVDESAASSLIILGE